MSLIIFILQNLKNYKSIRNNASLQIKSYGCDVTTGVKLESPV